MPCAANFHDQVADARLPEAAGVVDHAAARAATVDVFDAHAATGKASMGRVLVAREGSPPRRLRRHAELALIERARQDAQLLAPPTARGEGSGGGRRHPLAVGTPGRGRTPDEHGEPGVDPPHMVDGVARFLAAITARRRRRSVGTPAAPGGALRPNRGEGGAGAAAGVGRSAGGGGSCPGTTSALASVSVTPRRFASSVTDRVGASPSAHSVACRTVNKT